MEIREYDTSYDLLNQHLYTNNSIYKFKRYPPIFLKLKNEFIEIIKKSGILMMNFLKNIL